MYKVKINLLRNKQKAGTVAQWLSVLLAHILKTVVPSPAQYILVKNEAINLRGSGCRGGVVGSKGRGK